MTEQADDYNKTQILQGRLNIESITELVAHWQETHQGLAIDGKAGSQTLASIAGSIARRAPAPRPALDELGVAADWLTGPGVTRVAAHDSWYGKPMTTGRPLGIVAHYTATGAGTALTMARRRARQFGQDKDDRLASWHITIETDGSIVVMIPLVRIAWHAGSSTAQPVPGLGNANANTIGIELVGHGKEFPAAQVQAAARVWRALVQHYGIARRHAMITHASIDPTRRGDPGPVWMAEHAEHVLELAYRSPGAP
ncbi:MAG TPA: peptidoglycan recognition family protein [Kofleriaceae bacterium]|jgi:hypothetical protein|nr:peptidoglycan recognition family protein [Kofleriaceae bacterium]